jgi:hypothetical protein
VRLLREHRRRQAQERLEAGDRWVESGYVFTNPVGEPLNPDYLSRRFRYLVRRSGLPPVRLHDLRHGAATLAHAVGADLKTVQEQLGHTSIVLTADTYTSVLMILHFKVAEATARLVLTAAARKPGRRHRRHVTGGPPRSAAPAASTGPEPVRPKRTPPQGPESGAHPRDTQPTPKDQISIGRRLSCLL